MKVDKPLEFQYRRSPDFCKFNQPTRMRMK